MDAADDDLIGQLVPLWEEVLEKEHLSHSSNFFLQGGHSLLAVQLARKIEMATGQEVPLEKLYESPTPEDFAEYIRQGEESD